VLPSSQWLLIHALAGARLNNRRPTTEGNRTIIKALHAAGYVCVPREATARMVEDGWAAANEEDAQETWRAMLEFGVPHTS
jgi:hypothetical protein